MSCDLHLLLLQVNAGFRRATVHTSPCGWRHGVRSVTSVKRGVSHARAVRRYRRTQDRPPPPGTSHRRPRRRRLPLRHGQQDVSAKSRPDLPGLPPARRDRTAGTARAPAPYGHVALRCSHHATVTSPWNTRNYGVQIDGTHEHGIEGSLHLGRNFYQVVTIRRHGQKSDGHRHQVRRRLRPRVPARRGPRDRRSSRPGKADRAATSAAPRDGRPTPSIDDNSGEHIVERRSRKGCPETLPERLDA